MRCSILVGVIVMSGLSSGTWMSTGLGGEIGFVEDFALSRDRTAALKQLVPGTEDYYYYNSLHFLNTEHFEKARELTGPWHQRHGQTARLTEIQTRHALLTYDKHPQATLDYLRNKLGLTGTKEGCGEGECGACSVLIDGEVAVSCLVPLCQVEGAKVVTVEGLTGKHRLHPMQQAFLECGGAQCGICTPGMVLAAFELLSRNQDPTEEDVRVALAGNLCRCTGYMRIFASVLEAVRRLP